MILRSFVLICILALCSRAAMLPRASAYDDTPTNQEDTGLIEFMACISAKGGAAVSAHRGGPAPGYPENALETFERGRKAGVRLFEVDIMQSSDGALYLMHDRTLERTSTGEGPTDGLPLSEIRGLSLEDNAGVLTEYKIPTLREALQWAKAHDSFLNIDLKRYADVETLANIVLAEKADHRIAVIAADLDIAIEAAEKLPRALISVSLNRNQSVEDIIATGIAKNRLVVWAGFRQLDSDRIQSIKDAGLYVTFGTLGFGNSYDDRFAAEGNTRAYAQLATMGIVMIATDRPIAARKGLTEGLKAWDSYRICD